MSRFNDRRRRLARGLVAAGTGAGLVIAGSLGARADPGSAGQAGPVLTITAPVLDLVTTIQSTDGSEKVQQEKKKVTITLDATVLFPKDSPALSKAADSRISDAANVLRSKKPGPVTITGYTDDLGTKEHGLILSRQRAAAVAKVLKTKLPASYPLKTIGMGEAHPAVPNTSEKNRRKNRRVVITYG